MEKLQERAPNSGCQQEYELGQVSTLITIFIRNWKKIISASEWLKTSAEEKTAETV